jgi:hypothetical protein
VSRKNKRKQRRARWEQKPTGQAPDVGPSLPATLTERPSFEVWSLAGFVIVVATLLVYVAIGMRLEGPAGLWLYRVGPLVAGLLCAGWLFLGLVRAVLRRPVLQRGRVIPLLLLAVGLWLASYPLAYPSPHAGHPSRAEVALPFEGEWAVRWGGARRETNALVLQPDRCFGFDFVRLGPDGTNKTLGAQVLAPLDATVAGVFGTPGGASGGPLGACVVLVLEPRRFLFLSNLDPDSIGVRAGEEVRRDQLLGLVGASALSRVSPEPFLGVHLQDTPVPLWGQAVPFEFHGYETDGGYESDGRSVPRGIPRGGVVQGSHLGEKVRRAKEMAFEVDNDG